MKTLLVASMILLTSLASQAQMIIRVEMTENIDGICDPENVYVLFNSLGGQTEPKCSVSKEEMQAQLNQIQFLIDNPKFKGKGSVEGYISCEGQALEWAINSSTEPAFDKEVLTVFQTYREWTSGTVQGKNVDCQKLFTYTIKKGKLLLD